MIGVEKNWLQKIGMLLFGPWLVKKYPFQEMYFLDQAKKVRDAVSIPLVLLGGIVSLDNITKAMDEGFAMVAIDRPLIYDPQFVFSTSKR